MKLIGKKIHFIKAGDQNPRNGEGSFVALGNKIIYAYTEYCSSNREDHGTANICAIYSYDQGESWSTPRVIAKKDENAENIMSPSFIELKNGGLAIIYVRKEKLADGAIVCMPVFATSHDKGESFDTPCELSIPRGYYCAVNDSAIVSKSGRILVPLSYHGKSFNPETKTFEGEAGASVVIAYSDDSGASWSLMPHIIESPFSDNVGLAEPGIYEHLDGRLWCWFRTPYGHQYQSFSADSGKSWTDAKPNFHFTSPDAPMRVKKACKYTVAVFNPTPYSCIGDSEPFGSPKRTPLVCAISTNDGIDFDSTGKSASGGELLEFSSRCYLLEDDPKNSFCYPAVLGIDEGFLVAYYDSDGTDFCLSSTKIKKVLFSEL